LLLAAGGTARGSARIPHFDAERSFSYLVRQCSFGPRVPGSSARDSVVRYFAAFFEGRGGRVEVQEFKVGFGDSQVTAKNLLISFFPGLEPRVLLCAHYDSRPRADSEKDVRKRSLPVPGANDGASGAAVLMEIANALSSHTPLFGVDLALFDAEDLGGLGGAQFARGSAYFAQRLRRRPSAAILLDMVGDRDLGLKKEGYSVQAAPELVEAVWEAAARLGRREFLGSPGGFVYDDHVELLKAGVPAVDIIDFDYPYWHTTEDTPDKCSPGSLEAVGSTLLYLLYDPSSPLLGVLKR